MVVFARYCSDTYRNEAVCPYCGTEDTDEVDHDENSAKRICRECGEDYIVWYTETTEAGIEDVTTRNGFKLTDKEVQ